jgi:hypothetical protein
MERLNSNNFLVWEGEFNEIPFSVIAPNDSKEEALEQGFAELFPLVTATATFGINFASFEILSGDNPDRPHLWDPITGTFIYYPNPDTPLFTPIVLIYRFRDLQGNYSNNATLTIEFF